MSKPEPGQNRTTEIVKRPLDPLRWLVAFHKEIRASLDRLDGLAGAPDAEGAAQVADSLLQFFTGPVAWHDLDEEVSLLPRLRRAAQAHGGRVVHVDQCTHEHEQMESLIEATLPALSQLASGQDIDRRALRSSAARLRAILESHLRMEETNLFPLARRLLSTDELQELLGELIERDRMRRQGVRRAVEIAPPLEAGFASPDDDAPPRPENTVPDDAGAHAALAETEDPIPEAPVDPRSAITKAHRPSSMAPAEAPTGPTPLRKPSLADPQTEVDWPAPSIESAGPLAES